MSDLTAAILAGGQGTRLRAVVADRQKVVASVAGRPFIYRLLDHIAEAGIKRVVICTGYQAAQVSATLGKSYRQMALRYSAETEPLGTAGALRQAQLPSPVLVMNGDSFCEVDLPALFKVGSPTLVVREVVDTAASGRIDFDEAGNVTKFNEKGQAGPGWINAGVYLLNREIFDSIPAGRAVSIERETFPAWIGRGLRVFPTTGKFLDIGTPASYATAQRLFQ